MSAKNIPEVGEVFEGYVPGKRKLLHVSFGVATASPDVSVGEIAVYNLVDVSMPIVVFGFWTQVEEAFTTSVTATIGDTGSADRYIADTTMNIAATGAILVAGTGLSVPLYDSVGLDINVTIAGATAAAGLAHVYIDYAELND